MYVFIFSKNLPETFVVLRSIKRHIIINAHKSSCQVSVTFVRFQWNLNFLGRFSKSPQISNLMKIRRGEPSCSMRTGSRTDRQTCSEQSPFEILRTRLKTTSHFKSAATCIYYNNAPQQTVFIPFGVIYCVVSEWTNQLYDLVRHLEVYTSC
jgi:hypothetical protein